LSSLTLIRAINSSLSRSAWGENSSSKISFTRSP
jgi:hypothetical protein